MAEIQMIYLKDYCDHYDHYLTKDQYCLQCHTEYADGVGCAGFHAAPGGSCIYAKLKSVYKGITVKNYTIEEQGWDDIYGNTMEVSVRDGIYSCEKVILNGECLFDETEDAAAGAAEGGGNP